MSLKHLIKQLESATVEIAAGMDEKWETMSKSARKAYIEKHPKSKFAKMLNSPVKKSTTKSEKPASGPKQRGPKFIKDVKRKTEKPAEGPKQRGKKPVAEEKPKTQKTKTKTKTSKPVNKKSSNRKGRPASISPKEKIKRKQAKIKDLQSRLQVLAAEKSWRNVARSYSKRDTTKERLAERIKKIGELTKGIQVRIKNMEKRIKELQSSM